MLYNILYGGILPQTRLTIPIKQLLYYIYIYVMVGTYAYIYIHTYYIVRVYRRRRGVICFRKQYSQLFGYMNN